MSLLLKSGEFLEEALLPAQEKFQPGMGSLE